MFPGLGGSGNSVYETPEPRSWSGPEPQSNGFLFQRNLLGVRPSLDAVELDGHRAAAFHQEVILDLAPAGYAVEEPEVLEVFLVDKGDITTSSPPAAPEEAHELRRYARWDTGALAGSCGQDLYAAFE